MTKFVNQWGFILAIFALTVSCASTQPMYSSSNKKAVKLFELGKNEPRNSVDPRTGGPNFRKGLMYLQQAIEKDPNFTEAHLFAGEFSEILGDTKTAAYHYEQAIKINPNHSTTFLTYYLLGSMQYLNGDYEAAIKNLEFYTRQRNTNPDYLNKAHTTLANCDFALKQKNNPNKINPINIGPGINTADPEYFPTLTVDGKTMLFTRRIKDSRVTYGMQEDFFVSHLSNNGVWATAIPMPDYVNTTANEGAPTIAADGRTLIFVACAENDANEYGAGRQGKGSCDMFITKKLGTQWTKPQNLPGLANTATWESQPSLSSDGKTMYFIRRVSRRGEAVDSDIFVTYLQEDGSWSKAERLPDHINTKQMEESVTIHPDGKTLYFASRGHVGMGGSDLYMCQRDDQGNWSKPINLGYPINTQYDENSLLVGPEGDVAFFASDREGGYGGLDIYYFEMPPSLRPTKTLYFEGVVFDQDTRKPVPGKFKLVDLQTGKEVVYSEADKVTGEFLVSLPVNREYALSVEYPGYAFFSANFNMTNPKDQTSVHMDVPLVPLNSTTAITLNNVFFDLSKATLRKESYVELNKLVTFLNDNPSVRIEVAGHTDTRGDAKENLTLSQQRAESVKNYLTSQGIAAGRLQAKGYGETMPKISDTEISKLSSEEEIEKAHQLNRRTEYRILK